MPKNARPARRRPIVTLALALALVLVLAVAALSLAAPAAADTVEERRAELMAEYTELIDQEGERPEAERLNALFDLIFRHQLFENPIMGVMLGRPDAELGRWGDNSLAAVKREERITARVREVVESIDRGELEGSDRLHYDLLRHHLEQRIAGQQFPDEYLVIDQMGGPQQWMPSLLTQIPVRSVRGYEGLLDYLRGMPEQLEHARIRMEKGLEEGITPPRVTLGAVAEQIGAQAPEDPEQSPLYRPFADMPESIPEAERERIRSEARRLISQEVAPAFRKLRQFWEEEYLPAARNSIALGDLPGGQEWYAHNVRTRTTTELTPQEIHDIGLAEVKRIRAEMDEVIGETGFEGTFEEFLEHLRTDERFYFDTPEELLAAYRDIAKRIDPELVKLFGRLPRLPYGVEPVPEYSEKSQTTAYYQPGSLEGGRPGTFFANTYDLPSRPSWEMEALTLHEAVPGHHFQISLAQELEEAPEILKHLGTTAFVEGWGLYAESLGEELGLYRDPYARFGQLTYEMWRAIRLVVDTGIHSLGWSRQRAIDFFAANTGKAMHDIEVEVDRYIVWPGQALAYKIGELKIKELRAYAEEELGDAFDLREFHDRVLANGAVPLDVLEAQIRDWVEEQTTATTTTSSSG